MKGMLSEGQRNIRSILDVHVIGASTLHLNEGADRKSVSTNLTGDVKRISQILATQVKGNQKSVSQRTQNRVAGGSMLRAALSTQGASDSAAMVDCGLPNTLFPIEGA